MTDLEVRRRSPRRRPPRLPRDDSTTGEDSPFTPKPSIKRTPPGNIKKKTCLNGTECLSQANIILNAMRDELAALTTKNLKDQQAKMSKYMDELRDLFSATVAEAIENETLARVFAQQIDSNKEMVSKALNVIEVNLIKSTSYAGAAAKNCPPPISRSGAPALPSKPAIVIFPTDDTVKDSTTTKAMIESAVRPRDIGVKITGVKLLKNRGVIINTATVSDSERLVAAPCFTTGKLEAKIANKKMPRVIIYDVPRTVEDTDFLSEIYSSLKEPKPEIKEFIKTTTRSHLAGPRDGPTCHRVFHVLPTVRHALIAEGRCYMDWSSFRVRDFTGATMCTTCFMYGHPSRICKERQMCSHCALHDHKADECPRLRDSPKCATCTRYGKPALHKTGDKLCPAYLEFVRRTLNSIDYGC